MSGFGLHVCYLDTNTQPKPLRSPPTTFGEVVKGHPSGWELKGRPAQAGASEPRQASDGPARYAMEPRTRTTDPSARYGGCLALAGT